MKAYLFQYNYKNLKHLKKLKNFIDILKIIRSVTITMKMNQIQKPVFELHFYVQSLQVLVFLS
jgi:hypothetical protein